MLKDYPVTTTIPTTNLERAKKFYKEVLGLSEVADSATDFGVLYECGNKTTIYVYVTEPQKESHHPASFTVPDIKKTMETLSQKGVTFEKLDIPGGLIKDSGVIHQGNMDLAFFKDPDGNVLSLLQINN
jgi:catechol 2,3-dioxygenase-like lactoylglutathione lyase family enzyme